MKTEKEDGLSIKRTRYSFLAPGAIGKGRGRGLKSLASKEKFQTNKLFPQSSGLVKQYIQEIETSTIDKEQEQGPANLTMSSAQGNGEIRNNSVVLDKEFMQVDTPFSPSTNQVKQYTQNAETNAIGKGREKRLNKSTMFHSQRMEAIQKNSMILEKNHTQVHTPLLSSTNHVKQCTKEDEKDAIGKEREQTPRSVSSFLEISSKKNVRADEEMKLVDKTFLDLEKENMQIDTSSPPTADQVLQPSQTTDMGSSNTKKVRRVRGSNKCKEVVSLEAGQKLKVTFYNNRTVEKISNLFSRHLGKIIRDCNMCPLAVSSWNDIKQQKSDHMWAAIVDKFESVDMDDHRDHIFGWLKELWNKWRGYLHATYVKNKPIAQALKNIPKGVDKKDWEWLVKEHFCSESFQLRSSRNAKNRAKLKMFHHIGSKPIREIIYQQGGKDGNPPNLATIFFETRKKDNQLVEPEAIEKYIYCRLRSKK